MVFDKPNIYSTENKFSNSNDLTEIIQQLQQIRLSLDLVESRVRRLQSSNSTHEQTAVECRSNTALSQEVSHLQNRPSSNLTSKWGFTEGDKVRIKNPVDVSGYRVPQVDRIGYVVNFTSRFVQVKIRFKKDKESFEKVVQREPQNIELITTL